MRKRVLHSKAMPKSLPLCPKDVGGQLYRADSVCQILSLDYVGIVLNTKDVFYYPRYEVI